MMQRCDPEISAQPPDAMITGRAPGTNRDSTSPDRGDAQNMASMTPSTDKRHAATAHYAAGTAAINAMFDRADNLRDLLDQIRAAAGDSDVVHAARDVLEVNVRLDASLNGLRDAAIAAAAYRSKSDLAADLGTRVGLLFSRPATSGDDHRPDDRQTAAPVGSAPTVGDDAAGP